MKKKNVENRHAPKSTSSIQDEGSNTIDPGDIDIFRTIAEQSHDAVIIHTDMKIVYAGGEGS